MATHRQHRRRLTADPQVPRSSLDDLRRNSLHGWHYDIRDIHNGTTLLYMWIDAPLDTIPPNWPNAQFKLRHPLGDFESSTLKVCEVTESTIHLEGQMSTNNDSIFGLVLYRSPKSNLLYEGIFQRGRLVHDVTLDLQECAPPRFLTPLTIDDANVRSGNILYHQGAKWHFVAWYDGWACEVQRVRDDGTLETRMLPVAKCRRNEERARVPGPFVSPHTFTAHSKISSYTTPTLRVAIREAQTAMQKLQCQERDLLGQLDTVRQRIAALSLDKRSKATLCNSSSTSSVL